MPRINYSERLHQSLKEGGFVVKGPRGGRPRAYTFVRKGGGSYCGCGVLTCILLPKQTSSK